MRRTYLLALGGLLLVGVLLWWGATLRVAPEPPQPTHNIRFGFIRSVNVDAKTIEFDGAEWLTGEAAKETAIAAGVCTQETRGECAPNDYFISNDSSSTVTLPLLPEVVIAMMTLNAEAEGVKETNISLSDFGELLNNKERHWKDLPYQILEENNVVTIVEEVYVP